MRIRIVFSLQNKGGYVPFHHQHLLAQLTRELVNMQGELYHNFMDYNFSGLKGQTKISRKGLHFYSSKVTLVFASSRTEFVQAFLRNLFSQPEVQVGSLVLKPEYVEQEHLPKLNEVVKYVCLSPIILTDPTVDIYQNKKFVSPQADDFSDLLYENTLLKMERTGNYSKEQIASFYKFQIAPDKNYLKKIKDDDKKFARIYTIQEGGQRLEVRGYTLPFTLYAAREVQEFIFISGLGALSHKGFGMVDMANADAIRRTSVLFQHNEG